MALSKTTAFLGTPAEAPAVSKPPPPDAQAPPLPDIDPLDDAARAVAVVALSICDSIIEAYPEMHRHNLIAPAIEAAGRIAAALAD